MMSEPKSPARIIDDMIYARRGLSDEEVLAELSALPAMEDENHPCWDEEEYWLKIAYPFLALASLSRERRLRPAIRLLLERACYGDPGEIMRGLRHDLEAIVEPDWSALADICLELARSTRLGTKLWAIDELCVLDDPRAQSLLEDAARMAPRDIRNLAEIGLWG